MRKWPISSEGADEAGLKQVLELMDVKIRTAMGVIQKGHCRAMSDFNWAARLSRSVSST